MNLEITDAPVSALGLYVTAGLAFLLGLTLPLAVKPLLVKWNMVDIPTARSSHTRPTYRGMGLATALASLFSFGLALALGFIPSDRAVALTIFCGMIASCLLGWLEDVRGVSIVKRFGSQILIGLLVSLAITIILGTAIWWIPLGIFAVAAYINVVNFMDGVNGMSGIHGLVAGGFFAYAGVVNHVPWLAIGGLALAASFLAFLPWNIRTGHNVFLGDAGSYFLGGTLACFAVGAFLSGVYIEYIIAPFLIYLADTGFTLVRRILKGEQWYKPHRTHVYQRLTDYGFTHLASSLTVAAFTLAVGLLSLLALHSDHKGQMLAGFVVMCLLVLYLCLPTLLAKLIRRSTRCD